MHGACTDHLSNMHASQDIPTASTTIQEAPRTTGRHPAATMLGCHLPHCHHLCCPHCPCRHAHAARPNACQVRPPEPGSTTYNEQLWWHSRNEKIIGEMQTQAEITAQCQWDHPVSAFHATGAPLKVSLYVYDTLMSVSVSAPSLHLHPILPSHSSLSI